MFRARSPRFEPNPSTILSFALSVPGRLSIAAMHRPSYAGAPRITISRDRARSRGPPGAAILRQKWPGSGSDPLRRAEPARNNPKRRWAEMKLWIFLGAALSAAAAAGCEPGWDLMAVDDSP